MNRRVFLSCLGIGLGGVSGCTENNSSSEVTSQPAPTPSPGRSSPIETASPRSVLPESQSGWTLEETSDYLWSPIGGSDGAIGHYEGPDGNSYQFVVMRDENNADGSARQFACAGWQIAFAYDGLAIAASSGTEQRTFTAHAPPTMTVSPAENRMKQVRELLLLSPILTESDVRSTTECPDGWN